MGIGVSGKVGLTALLPVAKERGKDTVSVTPPVQAMEERTVLVYPLKTKHAMLEIVSVSKIKKIQNPPYKGKFYVFDKKQIRLL